MHTVYARALCITCTLGVLVLMRAPTHFTMHLLAGCLPGLRYIQGMNELIAPLYHLFKHDTSAAEAKFAEADAFWCVIGLVVGYVCACKVCRCVLFILT
jgi:hypothetical protein